MGLACHQLPVCTTFESSSKTAGSYAFGINGETDFVNIDPAQSDFDHVNQRVHGGGGTSE
ncbi:hypothetical protein AYL99_02551 [Fonsecaea erecta]|uniref:Uncharacterized protein n=1 Tax=Fonsecaea erecta TaxID=1367422 RepID=A0A178ZU77_9EURO|nr:hypothetical protein AYL99_02551 [Fonsecaea erecta]OAP63324.1 hypothetical protein AYL99_02551 [Fonsecaea erecta]